MYLFDLDNKMMVFRAFGRVGMSEMAHLKTDGR